MTLVTFFNRNYTAIVTGLHAFFAGPIMVAVGQNLLPISILHTLTALVIAFHTALAMCKVVTQGKPKREAIVNGVHIVVISPILFLYGDGNYLYIPYTSLILTFVDVSIIVYQSYKFVKHNTDQKAMGVFLDKANVGLFCEVYIGGWGIDAIYYNFRVVVLYKEKVYFNAGTSFELNYRLATAMYKITPLGEEIVEINKTLVNAKNKRDRLKFAALNTTLKEKKDELGNVTQTKDTLLTAYEKSSMYKYYKAKLDGYEGNLVSGLGKAKEVVTSTQKAYVTIVKQKAVNPLTFDDDIEAAKKALADAITSRDGIITKIKDAMRS